MKTFTPSELRKDPKWRKALQEYDPKFDVSTTVQDLRITKGLTQAKFAKKIGLEQSAIARIERGGQFPSLKTLDRIARSFKLRLRVEFETDKEALTRKDLL